MFVRYNKYTIYMSVCGYNYSGSFREIFNGCMLYRIVYGIDGIESVSYKNLIITPISVRYIDDTIDITEYTYNQTHIRYRDGYQGLSIEKSKNGYYNIITYLYMSYLGDYHETEYQFTTSAGVYKNEYVFVGFGYTMDYKNSVLVRIHPGHIQLVNRYSGLLRSKN